MTVTAERKLTAQQARKIAAAEAAVATAKRALEDAKQERDAIRERYADRVPVGKWIVAGGLHIKRRVQTSGQTFRLAAFLKRHRITTAMRPFVSDGTSYEIWDVRPGG